MSTVSIVAMSVEAANQVRIASKITTHFSVVVYGLATVATI
jgi:hypothetical protein